MTVSPPQPDIVAPRIAPTIAVCGEASTFTGFGRVSHALHQSFLDLGLRSALVDVAPRYERDGTPDWRARLRDVDPDVVLLIGSSWTYPLLEPDIRNGVPAAAVFVYFVTEYQVSTDLAEGLSGADGIVTPTAWGRRELASASSDLRATVIGHGIDTAVFAAPITAEDRRAARDHLAAMCGIEANRLSPLIVLNGNTLTPRKAIPRSVEAIAAARRRSVDVQLCLPHLATGRHHDLEEEIGRAGLTDTVLRPRPAVGGHRLSIEELRSVLWACDVGLNTSFGEGWGLVSWEHGATGAAQIVPDTPAMRDVWGDAALFASTTRRRVAGPDGLVCHLVDTDDIARSLQNLSDSPPRLAELGALAYEHVTSPSHRWHAIARRWLELFLEHGRYPAPVTANRSQNRNQGESSHAKLARHRSRTGQSGLSRHR